MINFRTNPSPWGAILLLAVAATASAQIGDTTFRGENPLDYCMITIIDQVSVPAEEQGVLDVLNVYEGMVVEKGALLGTIDDTDAKLALAMAKHEHESAKKKAENELSVKAAEKSQLVMQAEYESAAEANERLAGTITATEVRRKRLQSERAMMQIELAQHELFVARLDAQAIYQQLERTKAALQRRQIVSRINGIVVELNKHEGDWVEAGETVMRIVRMDQLYVEGDIDGKIYARHLVIGRPVDIEVKLTGGGEPKKMEGTIIYASPLVESNEYTVRVVPSSISISPPVSSTY